VPKSAVVGNETLGIEAWSWLKKRAASVGCPAPIRAAARAEATAQARPELYRGDSLPPAVVGDVVPLEAGMKTPRPW
jgi:hypothetical protein